ncbi:tryptophan 7-halogenase [Candidatus Poribacteria bacterium]|nr:tryptophan 7-halogenase [Candidatus Poribacteria bacterium]
MIGTFDIAVVGSGFAGSLFAMIAQRLGRSVVLLERGTHPRFAIGESSSPLANLLLEELARRYDLPRLLPLTAWGSWQRTYPEIGCGLKRGFTFYHHAFGKRFAADPDRRDQLLVAASPNDEVSDTHWYRPDFDHFLVLEAQSQGVEYLDRVALDGVSWCGGEATIDGERGGRRFSIRARFVVDASGPHGFLHRVLGLRETRFGTMPSTQALYTHFSGVRRMEHMGAFPSDERPPYPVDDAALHHVFDGGWIWVLHFNNGITSAGVAVTDRLATDLRLAEGVPAWERLLARLPTVREQFADAEPLLPFFQAPRLSFRGERVAGPQWALLPSAAAFVDPLLSTGFPLTLLGIARLARAIEEDWGKTRFALQMDSHAQRTLFEADTAAHLVGALYASFNDFPAFASLSMLYFAAASFTETAHRLGRPELAGAFLLGDHPRFGPPLRRCCDQALVGFASGDLTASVRGALLRDVRHAIEPINVAGLSDPSRRNWYPVDARDLLSAAGKLGANEAEIQQLLNTMSASPVRLSRWHTNAA